MRVSALLALLAALAPCVAAQRAAVSSHAVPSGRPAVTRSNPPAGNFSTARGARGSGVRRSRDSFSLPFPFWGDFFDSDDLYSTGYPVASEPPFMLVQTARDLAGSSPDSMARDAAPRDDRGSSSNQPLMLELQNGRYVRVSNPAADGDALPLALTSEPGGRSPATRHSARNSVPAPASSRASLSLISSSPPPALQPAVLIFRDGHSEEVRDYAIADGVLYARGDYYTDGYWNKQISLASLNIPDTLQANAARNVKFVLPSSPNEVVTRP